MKTNWLRKHILTAAVLLAVLILFPTVTSAAETSRTADSASAAGSQSAAGNTSTAGASSAAGQLEDEQAEKSGASDLYSKVPDGVRNMLGKLGIRQPDAGTLSRFTPAGLFGIVWRKLKDSAAAPLRAATAVFGILIACALLGTMKSAVGEKPLKTVFDVVCILSIASVLLTPIIQCIRLAAQTVKQSADFMLDFLPVFVGLAAASGHPASAVVSQGLLLVSSQVISQIASTTFVPMVNIFLAFCVIASVSPGIQITGIAAFGRKAMEWGLGICMTVFTGILTVQGLIAQAADTVSMKTAKFVVGSAVPVIGSAIGDAVNTVVSCAGLLKTAVGAYAIVVFILAYLPVLLNCLMWLLTAELSVAFAEMLGITAVPALLKSVCEALKLLVALVLTSALAMIISVTVMLMLGSGS